MIAGKTWREVRWMGLVYALHIELMLVPAILLWPNIRNEAAAIGRIIPIESFQRMFEAISSADATAAYSAYMAVQMFFKGVNIIGIAGAVLLGTGLIARERENQTLEFLLARPVRRAHVLWSKFWVVALVITVPVFVTSWSAIPLSRLPSVDEHLEFWPVTLGAMHSSAFAVAILCATLVFSVIARNQVHTAFMIGGVVTVQVAIYFIQEIRVASIFRLSDWDVYGPILAGNVSFSKLFFGTTIWILLGGAVLYVVADRLFQRVKL